MAWEFHVGQRVVCVNDRWDDRRPLRTIAHEVIPTAGVVYTIREIGFLMPHYPDSVCVRLEEISNPLKEYVDGTFERAFGVYRFRPLRERKTSIECFRALLNTNETKVDA